MDTYCNAHNRRLNHVMLALHCYLSWAFVIALVLTGLEVGALLIGGKVYPWVSSGSADVAFVDSGHSLCIQPSTASLFSVTVSLCLQDVGSGYASQKVSVPAQLFLGAFCLVHLALLLLTGKRKLWRCLHLQQAYS